MSDKVKASFGDKAKAALKAASQDSKLVRLLFIMIGAFVLMAALKPSGFLTVNNFKSMAYQIPELGIYAIAVMLAMLLGGIDLSVVGIGNLSGILSCFLMIKLAPSIGNLPALIVGIVFALFIGMLCGLLNGILIAKIGIPAMIATLGSMEIFSGLGVMLTSGSAVMGMPEEFAVIGNGAIFGFPVPMALFIVVVAIFTIYLQKKQFGMELYLLGTNPKAARFTGIKNDKVVIKAHMLGGVLAAVGGLILASHSNSAKADYGSSYTLQSILICVLGGVSPSGGFGKVTGIVMAIFTLQFLSSGFNLLRLSSYQKTFIWGAVLVATMIINYYGDKRAERKKREAAKAEKAA